MLPIFNYTDRIHHARKKSCTTKVLPDGDIFMNWFFFLPNILH